jgi:hypothetical protein
MKSKADRKVLDIVSKHAAPGSVHRVFHYLYFEDADAAAPVVAALRAEGFEVIDRTAGMEPKWLVLACHEIVPSETAMAKTRALMEHHAAGAGGEYDGWEVEILAN